MPEFLITEIRFTAASSADVDSGLLGWASCTMNGTLRLDGIAVRRTANGRLALSFPSRIDARGCQHFILRPLTDDARREIERQIFEALGLQEATR